MDEKTKTIVHVTRGTGQVNIYNGNGNANVIKRSLVVNNAIKKMPFEEGYLSEEELRDEIMATILSELPQDKGTIEVRIY